MQKKTREKLDRWQSEEDARECGRSNTATRIATIIHHERHHKVFGGGVGRGLTGHRLNLLLQADLVAAAQRAQSLITHGKKDDGKERRDKREGGADVP